MVKPGIRMYWKHCTAEECFELIEEANKKNYPWTMLPL